MDHKEAEWRGWESGEGFMRVGVEGKKRKRKELVQGLMEKNRGLMDGNSRVRRMGERREADKQSNKMEDKRKRWGEIK